MKIKIRSPAICKDTLDDFRDVIKRVRAATPKWKCSGSILF